MGKSKAKSSIQEAAAGFDRLPERQRIYEEVRNTLEALASFYEFESIYALPFAEERLLSALAKAGMLEERKPFAPFYPSLLLPVLRAYSAHAMQDWQQPLKLRASGDVFFEKRGSSVKESQELSGSCEFGLVVIGDASASAEAEIAHICWKGLEEFGLDSSELGIRLNAAGCGQCRSLFRASLTGYFRPRASRLCGTSRVHLRSRPVLIFKCPEERCQILARNAPQILDFLCDSCKKHLRAFLEVLDELRIPYILDPSFFREGSWYDKLVWEITHSGSKGAEEGGSPPEPVILGEGGRLHQAAEVLTDRKLDAAGGALFIEKLEKIGNPALSGRGLDAGRPVFVAQLGEYAKRKSFGILETLRRNAIPASASLGHDSIKSQLKLAEKAGAALTLILGQKEVLDNTIIVREVGSGIQETVAQDKMVEFLKRKLKK